MIRAVFVANYSSRVLSENCFHKDIENQAAILS